MGRWERLKEKHWEDEWIKDPPGKEIGIGSWQKTPPLRKFARWIKKHWDTNPMACVTALMAIMVGISTIIFQIRH